VGSEIVPGMPTQRGWRLAHLVSRLLEPAERNAVCGDLLESGTNGLPALRDVMGLVVRRQMALWWDWRPWVALLGIVVPLGLLLSHAARAWADTHSVYVFLYVDNWTWLFLEIPGARRDLFLFAGRAALGALALAGVSWTSGFALGALSRRTAWVTLLLFAFAVLLGTAGTTTMTRANSFLNGLNGGVLAMPFYAVVFPRLARAILVIVPAWLGLRRSLQGRPLALLPLMAGAVTIAWLTIWPAERLTTSILRDRVITTIGPAGDWLIGTEPIPLAPWSATLVALAPLASIVTIAALQRWHRRPDSV